MTTINDGALDTAIFEGETAAQLLANPVLLKALDNIEAAAANAMIEAQNPTEREEKWYTTRAIRALRKELQKMQNGGEAARQTKAKRAKNGQK
ncbi:hypothetical protein [Caballeronia zhejiangensis]|uniref:hypothetical protein n=1 Tax=Caballeronia zhejiangensis TaxID=871203 RepID=UPI001F5206B6|nr:hypothetical protein [Caballeronia zhejiangensis]MCI1046924.1 hypothetical protein [Caballeronia zhejiangensis]